VIIFSVNDFNEELDIPRGSSCSVNASYRFGLCRAVHWVRYAPQDKLHIVSAGDDRTVRYWDVATSVRFLS
jgi:WD40 repeat protein